MLALEQAEEDLAAVEVENGYRNAVAPEDGPPSLSPTSAEVVLLELEAVPLALSVHQEQTKAGSAQPTALKVLGKAASTALGSMFDLFKLTDSGKVIVTTLRQALDIATVE